MQTAYLTQQEAAELLRLSPRTLERMRLDGSGPRFRKFGRRVLYAPDDLRSYADACVRISTSDPGPAEAA